MKNLTVSTHCHTKKKSLDMSNVTGQYYQMGIGKKDILTTTESWKIPKIKKKIEYYLIDLNYKFQTVFSIRNKDEEKKTPKRNVLYL